MDELSAPARRLMDLATAQDEPPAVAIEESWGMLVSRVEASEGSSPSPERADGPRARRWVIGGIGLVLGLAAVWFVLTNAEPRPEPTPAIAATPATPRSSSPAPLNPPVAADAPPPAGTPAPADAARLLDDAEAAIATEPDRALALLQQHAETDSDTTAVPRRLALRIQTLCALGRTADATHETAAFLRRHGDSTFAAAVRKACGAE